MHVSGISFDLYWVLQLVFTTLIVALGFRHLVKNTASKYFAVDANFDGGRSQGAESSGPRISGDEMLALDCDGDACIVCGKSASKKCSRCKAFRYCSQICQAKHWNSGHKTKCKEFKLNGGENSVPSVTSNLLRGASCHGGKSSGAVSLVPGGRTHKILQQPKMVLFPYDEFVKLFNWDKPGFPPCGLINCGNSCFANVVLQCLSCTRPLVAYLLEKDHRRACRRNDWCFLCELQIHVERSSSQHPFSPISILSRLPHIGGNLGYGKQEDAHEFMRFAIDTMQSVCLDEFGGEKLLHPSSQETTLIQHIFGGYLRSQVICTKCNNVSNRYENMMDLAVEIQGDVASLEDCLHQFTDKEWLDGENMYKCDGCNDYVKAWKRLTIHQAPNILTIALKRFQSGRFGKLNKRVTFPETLGLRPYMSEEGDAADLYKLYAVVVHLDMLNASFFGHYICYTKDFSGNWYWIDDCKVVPVDLEEVLSQGAYMLLYRRNCARPAFRFLEPLAEEQKLVEGAQPCSQQPLESFNTSEPVNSVSIPGCLTSNICSHLKDSNSTGGSSLKFHSEAVRRDPLYFDFDVPESSSSDSRDPRGCSSENYHAAAEITSPNKSAHGRLSDLTSSELSIVDAYSLENEFSSSNSDMEYGLENGNEERGNNVEIISSECKINGSSPHNHVQQISGTSLTVLGDDLYSASETIDETDPSRFENLQNTLLDQAGMIKSGIECPSLKAVEATVPKSRENSCSGAKLKPIFPLGFLGKRTRDTQTKRDGKPPIEPVEVELSCKVNGDCNGTAKPVFLDRSSGDVHDGEIPLDCDGTLIFRTSVGEQSENFIHMDEMDDIELGEVGNHKNCDCNGDDQFVNSQEGGTIVYERDAGHDASSRNCGDCSIKYNLPMVSYRFLDRPVGNPSGNEVGKAKSD